MGTGSTVASNLAATNAARFVDPASYDFHLHLGDPGIDAADDGWLDMLREDPAWFLGNNPDLGAVESYWLVGGQAGTHERMMTIRRYAAFLRGVSPMNAKMPALKRCFEAAGFDDVRTVLASGNVVFAARATSTAALARKAERAMTDGLGRTFRTLIRPLDRLRELLDEDPFAAFRLPAGAKRVVSFLADAPAVPPVLPGELDGARILCIRGTEALTAYVPSPRGPVFMTLIEKTFGQEVTTRTWDTIRKVVGDHPAGR